MEQPRSQGRRDPGNEVGHGIQWTWFLGGLTNNLCYIFCGKFFEMTRWNKTVLIVHDIFTSPLLIDSINLLNKVYSLISLAATSASTWSGSNNVLDSESKGVMTLKSLHWSWQLSWIKILKCSDLALFINMVAQFLALIEFSQVMELLCWPPLTFGCPPGSNSRSNVVIEPRYTWPDYNDLGT